MIGKYLSSSSTHSVFSIYFKLFYFLFSNSFKSQYEMYKNRPTKVKFRYYILVDITFARSLYCLEDHVCTAKFLHMTLLHGVTFYVFCYRFGTS